MLVAVKMEIYKFKLEFTGNSDPLLRVRFPSDKGHCIRCTAVTHLYYMFKCCFVECIIPDLKRKLHTHKDYLCYNSVSVLPVIPQLVA